MKKLLLAVSLLYPLSTTTLALADDSSAPTPAQTAPAVATPPALSTAQPDVPVTAPPDDPFKSVALTINPLSLALGRIGANVEILPARHHAIVINPFFQSLSLDSGDAKTSYTNLGGELGYHYYTGTRGASGFYVGPSLFAMNSNASTTAANGVAANSTSIFVYGLAIDVGAQYVAKNGFTIGGGAGAMYLAANDTNTATSGTFKVSGVLPRLLFTIGYSF